MLQGARLAVMPSLEEGFGLPGRRGGGVRRPGDLLEPARRCPKCSTSPRHASTPRDPAAIARAIERALTDEPHRRVLLAAGERAAAALDVAERGTRQLSMSSPELGPRWPLQLRSPAATGSRSPDRSTGRSPAIGRVRRVGVPGAPATIAGAEHGDDRPSLVDGSATRRDPAHPTSDPDRPTAAGQLRRWPVRADRDASSSRGTSITSSPRSAARRTTSPRPISCRRRRATSGSTKHRSSESTSASRTRRVRRGGHSTMSGRASIDRSPQRSPRASSDEICSTPSDCTTSG